MQSCPWCGEPFDGVAPFCTNCGKERVEPPQPEVKPPAAAAPAPPLAGAKAVAQRPALSRRALTAVGAVAALLAVMIAAVLTQPDSRPPTQSIAAGAATVASSSPASTSSVIKESAPRPAWVGRRQATWARDGSKTISFELAALQDVPVWMARVRPVLVVRCLFRKTEVFVATDSAASIEGQSDTHTVRLRVDDDQEELQQWTESTSAQQLFAPDGTKLAQRLAHARDLQFGFTPYNAKPVTAQFHVEGFDQLAGLVAKTCAWRASSR